MSRTHITHLICQCHIRKSANHHSVTRISVPCVVWTLENWTLTKHSSILGSLCRLFVSRVILLGKAATLQGATRCTTSGNTGRLCHRWALPPHQIIFSQEDQKQKVVFFGLDIWTIPQWRIEAKRRTGPANHFTRLIFDELCPLYQCFFQRERW